MNTLKIQEIDDQIAKLTQQVEALIREDKAKPLTMYVCTRCSCLYQSIWGCGCIQATRGPEEGTKCR
jgi:hypothetical protein